MKKKPELNISNLNGHNVLMWAIYHTPSNKDTPLEKSLYDLVGKRAAEAMEELINETDTDLNPGYI